MRNFFHGSIASLSLGLCACIAPPVVPPSDDEVYKSYVQGHMDMLRTHAPWMTDAERQAHARAQAVAVVKSLKTKEQFGRAIPPIMIPLPAPRSAHVPEAVETPASALPEPVVAASPHQAEPVLMDGAAPTPPPLPADSRLPSPEVAAKEPEKTSLAGTYVIEDGSYSMDVEQDGDDLVVVDSNKRSIYKRQGDGSYQFYNPNTGSTFSLRFLDEHKVEVDRVPSAGTPSILKQVEVQAATEAATMNEAYAAIAQRYHELAQSDADNAQAWTMCSAVAFKRSLSDGEDFSRYARQMAETLKLLTVDSTNPCSDAIPDSFW